MFPILFKTFVPTLDSSPPPILYFINRVESAGNFSPKEVLFNILS